MLCTLTTDAGGEKVVQQVSLPIIHNIKDLKEGDELILYDEPPIPKKTMPAQSLQAPLSQQAKCQQRSLFLIAHPQSGSVLCESDDGRGSVG